MIEFYFHFDDPWSYLAARYINTIAATSKTPVQWHPYLPRVSTTLDTPQDLNDFIVLFKRAATVRHIDLPAHVLSRITQRVKPRKVTSKAAQATSPQATASQAKIAKANEVHNTNANAHANTNANANTHANARANNYSTNANGNTSEVDTNNIAMNIAANLFNIDPLAAQNYSQIMMAGIYHKGFDPSNQDLCHHLLAELAPQWQEKIHINLETIASSPTMIHQPKILESEKYVVSTPALWVKEHHACGFFAVCDLLLWQTKSY